MIKYNYCKLYCAVSVLMIVCCWLQINILAADKVGANILEVKPVSVVEIYEAMGTVRPLTESEIHSQINAKVIDVLVTAGDEVEQGELLVRLDDREVLARLEQAREGLAIAEKGVEQTLKSDEELKAEYAQAESDYNRSSKLFKEGIHSKKEFEQNKTRFLKIKAQAGLSKERVSSAEASLRQAQQVVNEAEIFAEYASIRAINSGVITKRSVEPGDLATPSKTLLTLQTGSTLRLEAGVRESLINKVKIGMPLEVRVGSDDLLLTGVVEEIEPYADARTRSFKVKVGIPVSAGVYPGMFGRLLIPLDTVESIFIPQEAVTAIGQLKSVNLIRDDKQVKIFVKTGRTEDGMIEILSGLKAGDVIAY